MSECAREQEALDLVRAGRWPDGCDDETRAHITACADCGASVQVASMLAADYHAALRSARVPSSGLVWWRTQRRAREEAARTAARVITMLQAGSVAAGVALAVGIAGADKFGRVLSAVSHEMSTAGVFSQWSVPLLLGLAAWAAMAPVAVYLAVSRD